MKRYNWKILNRQQVGAFTEYFVKMELTMFGFQVYTTEVDDRGINFVARFDRGPFLEIQVKSLRDSKYMFVRKDKFPLEKNTFLALGLLKQGKEPELYLIPSLAWESCASREGNTFVDRNYEGLKSKPEWGLNLSSKNMPELEKYRFVDIVEKLIVLPETENSKAECDNESGVSKDQIDQLLAFLPYFKDRGDGFGESARFDEKVVDKGSMLPSVLNEKTSEFISACYDLGFIESFDWMSWSKEKSDLVNSGIGIESLELEDVRKLLTTHIRGDRFHDGHLLEVLRSNAITKILERLKAIRKQMS